MEMRKLKFADALTMQKILKKSGILNNLQDKLQEIDLNSSSSNVGMQIITTILTEVVDNFDLVEKEFIAFIEDIYSINNFKDLEMAEAFNLILNIRENESFKDFLLLVNKALK